LGYWVIGLLGYWVITLQHSDPFDLFFIHRAPTLKLQRKSKRSVGGDPPIPFIP